MTASAATPQHRVRLGRPTRPALLALALVLGSGPALAGKGGIPGITPTPFDFGPVPVGASSPPQVFTLANPSGEALTIVSSTLGGFAPTQYAIQANGCAGVVVAPGGNCTVTLRFAPSAAGSQVALLRVLYNAPSSPGGVELNATLAGTGLPPPPAPARPAPAVGTFALALGALLVLLGAWVGRRSA